MTAWTWLIIFAIITAVSIIGAVINIIRKEAMYNLGKTFLIHGICAIGYITGVIGGIVCIIKLILNAIKG